MCCLKRCRLRSRRDYGVNVIADFWVVKLRVITKHVIDENFSRWNVFFLLDVWLRARHCRNLSQNFFFVHRLELGEFSNCFSVEILFDFFVCIVIADATFFILKCLPLEFDNLMGFIDKANVEVRAKNEIFNTSGQSKSIHCQFILERKANSVWLL